MSRCSWVLAWLSIATVAQGADRPVGWNDATHGKDATPDYARVFNQDAVNRLDVAVTAPDWARLMADMADMAGPFGSGSNGGGGGGAGGGIGGGTGGQPTSPDDPRVEACSGKVEGSACQVGTTAGRCVQAPLLRALSCTAIGNGGPPPTGGGGGGQGADDVELLPRTPIYIPATVTFDGTVFRHVGLRLKGNSSLVNSWQSGVDKLPFRLNFDEMEKQYPEVDDQTFFGFPNLNLTNNSQDASFLRAKVVGDLFREAAVPAARTAFVRVYLDRGDGAVYMGLYTLVEVPDRPMLRTWFESHEGNLYKPKGTCARWTCFDPAAFPKKTNESAADWTDIQQAIAALNASRADAAAWRANLEAVFNVNGFLRWLALNTIIGNTDTYGSFSPHNYYLYSSPRHRDRIFWIPWDHDLALRASMGNQGGTSSTVDVFHTQVASSWPLIRFLLDDTTYRAAYRQHVVELLGTVFDASKVSATLRSEHARIAPYVVGDEGEQQGRTFLASAAEFEAAVYGTSGLLAYVESRSQAVRRALDSNP